VVDLSVNRGFRARHFAVHFVCSLHFRPYSCAGRLTDGIVIGLLNPFFGLLAFGIQEPPRALYYFF
jgi:hypothetical protein